MDMKTTSYRESPILPKFIRNQTFQMNVKGKISSEFKPIPIKTEH